MPDRLIPPGSYPAPKYYPSAILYLINSSNEELHWYKNEESSRPGGSKSWEGPKLVGTSWGSFTAVFSGGGPTIYAVEPDGDLLMYKHDGYGDGTRNWKEPRIVGWGLNGFKSIFSCNDNVIYGIRPDGDLYWHRHYGGDINSWSGPAKVGNGWEHFIKVFSGGKGVIYAIRENGDLLRYRHLGYLTGKREWTHYEEIGTGWNGFQEVVASEDGVLYAFTTDGRILWYRYGERERINVATKFGEKPNPKKEVVTIWEGPVEMKSNLPAFQKAFAIMTSEPPIIK